MSKRRTHEEFIAEMNIVNPNIKIVGRFVNMRTKIICQCKTDGYEWNATPDNLLRGHGCPKCAGCVKRTHKQFITEMAVLNPNIEITTSYINVDTIIGCRCKICCHEWYATPNNLLSGKGCKMCGYDALSRQHMNNSEKYLSETKEKVDVTFLSEYLGTTEIIKVKCNKCGYEWSPICKHLHNGIGCPRCNSSNGESLIQKYLDKHNIEYEFQKKFDDLVGINGRQLSYDFYIPKYNILVEFNGLQHYKPIKLYGGIEQFEKQKIRDEIKYNYAKDNGYNLLSIHYKDMKNIYQILDIHLFMHQMG